MSDEWTIIFVWYIKAFVKKNRSKIIYTLNLDGTSKQSVVFKLVEILSKKKDKNIQIKSADWNSDFKKYM